MLKAVLDTNILISSLIIPDKYRSLQVAIESGRIELIFSAATFGEFLDVLKRPKIAGVINRELRDELLELIKEESVFVHPAKNQAPIVFADPSDDKFLWAAKTGKADIVVSGDNHLLSVKSFEGIPIISFQEFSKRL